MSIFKNFSIVILLVAFTAPSYTGAVMNESQSRKIGDSVRSTSESGSSSPKISSIDQILQKTNALIKSRGSSSVDVVLTNLDRLINNTKDNTAKKAALVSLKNKIIAQRDTVDLSNISCIVPSYDYSINHEAKEDGWEITYFKDPRLPPKKGGDLEYFKNRSNHILEKLTSFYEKTKPDLLYHGYPYKKDFYVQAGTGVIFDAESPSPNINGDEKTRKKVSQILENTYTRNSILATETLFTKLDNLIPGVKIGNIDSENIAFHRYYTSEGGTATILRLELRYSPRGAKLKEVYSNGNWLEIGSASYDFITSQTGSIVRKEIKTESNSNTTNQPRQINLGKIRAIDGLISGTQFGDGAYPWRVKQIEFFHPEGVLNYNSSDCKK